MAWIDGGTFLMGSEEFYAEEGPVHSVEVGGFWIDRHPVTVRQFRRFVKATGHVTLAERKPSRDEYPDAEASLLVPGSMVFRPTRGPVDLDSFVWWHYVAGACWHQPAGPGSTTYLRTEHPVTHIAYEDALAYATWAGKELPTESQWEYAARGGLDGARFAWGDEETVGGRHMTNSWQGEFPWQNLELDGHSGTSPVGTYPPNGYGLHDMTGNVWEWTRDRRSPDEAGFADKRCCTGDDGRGVDRPRHVIKGGSHLCAPNYCLRYRPAARQFMTIDSSTTHLGFRCVSNAPGPNAG